ncbi:F-box/WD repeat-containing protein [Endozoicomonas acroporae]|uniref:F-box/WD repeat-containing protein n=1 Tax=Endozoicomonas acroporae TaxID=1701104 RepID=UPI000C760E72|nr:F-box protein [Endozoicomonas acroporae]
MREFILPLPPAQEKPDEPCLSETNPVIPEQSAHFHRWSITSLPVELLLKITGYLPLKDACNLALVSRRMHTVLNEYGLFEVVRCYGNLSKNEQLFYRSLSITNQPLIHHLRTSKIQVIAGQSYCTENFPAICAYHADHLRNETINATSLKFVLQNSFGREDNIIDYFLNENHSRLLINDRHGSQSSIWTAGSNGCWNREFTIEGRCFFDCFNSIDQYHDNTVFISVDPPPSDRPAFKTYGAKDALLSIIQRDGKGLWTETQQMTVAELFPHVGNEQSIDVNSLSFEVSPDGKSLIYSAYTTHSMILSRELNGQWATKGDCPRGYSIFSPDSNHIAIDLEECIGFFGKQKDGRWLANGILKFNMYTTALTKTGIDIDDIGGFDTIAFSPDSQHFAACFNYAGEDSDDMEIHVEDFFVVVFSLGDNGRWSETIRITKHQPHPVLCISLEVTFSPDSQYLVVHSEDNFDIWHLTDNNGWVAEIKDHDYFQKSGRVLPNSMVTFNVDSSVFVLFQEGSAMVWQLDGAGMWHCQHMFTYICDRGYPRRSANSAVPTAQKLSPDGHSIICTDDRGRLDIQVQKKYGEWVRQTPDSDLRLCEPDFNHGGSLFAGLDVNDKSCLVVLGITPKGVWQEKGRLQAEGCIDSFKFSPCGHSIQISSMDGDRKILSFWRIEREVDQE